MSCKDKAEVINVKKAAYMSASVMKTFVNPKIESIIEEEKEVLNVFLGASPVSRSSDIVLLAQVKHSKLSEETEDVISDPKKVNVKLRQENLEACYPPIFQSGMSRTFCVLR